MSTGNMCIENLVTCGCMVSEIRSRTDGHTQTDTLIARWWLRVLRPGDEKQNACELAAGDNEAHNEE